MRRNILIKIQYDGTKYSGWQRQGNTDNTIERKISSVISKMEKSDVLVELHASGRTDAGVHALGQVANFTTKSDLSEEEMLDYINQYLPEDIRILELYQVDDRFHSRLKAVGKTYVYSIDTNTKADVFCRKYSLWLGNSLDVDAMKALIPYILGEHDFITFSDMRQGKKSTVRNIRDICITEDKGIVSLEFTGNGFLYHMVRKLVAAFIKVGQGNMSIDDVVQVLNQKDRNAFKDIAPAKGLILKEVFY